MFPRIGPGDMDQHLSHSTIQPSNRLIVVQTMNQSDPVVNGFDRNHVFRLALATWTRTWIGRWERSAPSTATSQSEPGAVGQQQAASGVDGLAGGAAARPRPVPRRARLPRLRVCISCSLSPLQRRDFLGHRARCPASPCSPSHSYTHATPSVPLLQRHDFRGHRAGVPGGPGRPHLCAV